MGLLECHQMDLWEQISQDQTELTPPAFAPGDSRACCFLQKLLLQADLVVQVPMQKYLDG